MGKSLSETEEKRRERMPRPDLRERPSDMPKPTGRKAFDWWKKPAHCPTSDSQEKQSQHLTRGVI